MALVQVELEERLASYRYLASEWHTGQFSAMYGFASSGKVPKPKRLAKEVRDAIRDAERYSPLDVEDLSDMLHYLEG